MFCCYHCAVMCCPYKHSLPCGSFFRYGRSTPPPPPRPPRRMGPAEFWKTAQSCSEWIYIWTLAGSGDGYAEFFSAGFAPNEGYAITTSKGTYYYKDIYSIKCISNQEMQPPQQTEVPWSTGGEVPWGSGGSVQGTGSECPGGTPGMPGHDGSSGGWPSG